MLQKSTLLHLRIPFSFFLLPVFVFAISQSNNYNIGDAVLIFFILHFLLYPASNGYNSYFDKDEESIGGLEKPPPVSRELYFTSLVLDFLATVAGFFISPYFVLLTLVYGAVSKAYSHPWIRIKKYPYLSWAIAGIFQGYFTFMTIQVGLSGIDAFEDLRLNLAGVLCSALLLGSYPMTQVYQHKEDSRRGDLTLSLKLGIKGTFIFTAGMFTLAMGGFLVYFKTFYNSSIAWTFLGFLLPVLTYFLYWFSKVIRDEREADFRSTMRLNFISALCMNLFFTLLTAVKYYNLDVQL